MVPGFPGARQDKSRLLRSFLLFIVVGCSFVESRVSGLIVHMTAERISGRACGSFRDRSGGVLLSFFDASPPPHI